jgi:hypothetical protein
MIVKEEDHREKDSQNYLSNNFYNSKLKINPAITRQTRNQKQKMRFIIYKFVGHRVPLVYRFSRGS